MTKYILNSKNTPAKIFFTFDLNGVLKAFKVSDETTEHQVKWLIRFMPKNINELKALNESEPKFSLIKEPADLSFAKFWQTYNYKVGSKVKAEAIYKKLNNEQKALAISYISKYLNQIRMSGAAQAYPTTYLNQRYFES